MSLDGTDLDLTAYIERRRVVVTRALEFGRKCLAEGKAWYADAPSEKSRNYLKLAIACVETGEAELEALNGTREVLLNTSHRTRTSALQS